MALALLIGSAGVVHLVLFYWSYSYHLHFMQF